MPRRPARAPHRAARAELGAARVGATVTDDQGAFQSMLDPEGNEFCFVSA
ncbi:VOC family protein [Streptomyces scopuliridis]